MQVIDDRSAIITHVRRCPDRVSVEVCGVTNSASVGVCWCDGVLVCRYVCRWVGVKVFESVINRATCGRA